jgi:excisionase family DNA binding protein
MPAREPPSPQIHPSGNLDPATYTVHDIARLLQCSDRHIRRLDDRNLIPGKIRSGRLVRFVRRVVDQWIINGC